MKKYTLSVAIILSFCFSVQASYKIEVCKIRLTKILGIEESFTNAWHIFVRGETPLKVNVLSYDPINKDEIASILAGQNMNSRVANENYKDAKCETVLHTILKANYEKLWATIDNHYKEATKASYNLYSHNCGHVAKQALENADLAFPFFNINNQELSAPIKRVLQGQTDWSQPNEAIEASAALIGTAANMFTQNQSGEANKNCNIQ